MARVLTRRLSAREQPTAAGGVIHADYLKTLNPPFRQMNLDDLAGFPTEQGLADRRGSRGGVGAQSFMAAYQLMLHQLTALHILDFDDRAHICPAVERCAADDLGPLQQRIEASGPDGQDDFFLLDLQVLVISCRAPNARASLSRSAMPPSSS